MVLSDFEDQIRRIDAKLRRLNDLGIDLSLPGPAKSRVAGRRPADRSGGVVERCRAVPAGPLDPCATARSRAAVRLPAITVGRKSAAHSADHGAGGRMAECATSPLKLP